jgi:hypothetical protein
MVPAVGTTMAIINVSFIGEGSLSSGIVRSFASKHCQVYVV